MKRRSEKNGDRLAATRIAPISRISVPVSGRTSSTCQRGRAGAAFWTAGGGGAGVGHGAGLASWSEAATPRTRTVRSTISARMITAP